MLAGKPVTFRVLRKDRSTERRDVDITVQPAYRHDLGVRMRMGEDRRAARRRPGREGRRQGAVPSRPPTPGDRIKAVKLPEPTASRRGLPRATRRPNAARASTHSTSSIRCCCRSNSRSGPTGTRGTAQVKLVVLRTRRAQG